MMTPTTPAEIEDIISKFDDDKKTGPNSVPQPLFKKLKNHLPYLFLISLTCHFKREDVQPF